MFKIESNLLDKITSIVLPARQPASLGPAVDQRVDFRVSPPAEAAVKVGAVVFVPATADKIAKEGFSEKRPSFSINEVEIWQK